VEGLRSALRAAQLNARSAHRGGKQVWGGYLGWRISIPRTIEVLPRTFLASWLVAQPACGLAVGIALELQ